MPKKRPKKKPSAAEFLAKQKADDGKVLTPERLVQLLRKKRMTSAELASSCGCTPRQAETLIREMQGKGALIYLFGEHWGLERAPAPANEDERHVYESREDDTFLFGFSSDQHIGSRYHRKDVLDDLYDRFAEAGVDRVFNAGNWVDGESKINQHDLNVHGMDRQLAALAEQYPKRDGVVTYSVAGDDHEGWWAAREGVDVGRHAERIMHDAGRDDWINLGYMEAYVSLANVNTGKRSKLLVMHPGGGSAYALSYRPQKIVESFSGGEKPAVLLIGHYHKLSLNLIRNVWALQSGCVTDQNPWARKKGLDFHVGGGVCKLTQDRDTGAITRCQVEFFQYFTSGYYNNRWGYGAKVNQPPRRRARSE